MEDPYDLDRFVVAQNAGGVYDQAVAELRRGHKRSHWMWFVFPQLAGLGRSVMSQRFALSGIAEAVAFLQHPILGPRLRECTELVALAEVRTAEQIFGGVDAQKLRSCMTLFQLASTGEPVFHTVLDRFFDGAPDPATVDLLTPGQPQ